MKPLTIMILVIVAIFSIWLVLWDIVDWATQGLNEGIWETAILINGFPSIATGVVLLVICTFLGINVLRG